MKVATLVLALWFGTPAFAGDKVLNGGNAVVCRNNSGAITSVKMLDLFEAELRGEIIRFDQRKIGWRERLMAKLVEWKSVAPIRMQKYEGWLRTFEQEWGLYSGINIPAIPDHGSVAIPVGCELAPVAFQRPDEEILPGVKRYVVNKDLWDFMDDDHRAGLVLHEIVYRETMAQKFPTSFQARYLTGFLSSAVPESDLYLQVIGHLPLPFAEYRGLLAKSSNCALYENDQCQKSIPAIEFYSTGKPKGFEILGDAGQAVRLPNLTIEGSIATDPNFLGKVAFTERGFVSEIFGLRSKNPKLVESINFELPSPAGRTDYSFIFECKRTNCISSFEWRDNLLEFRHSYDSLQFKSKDASFKIGPSLSGRPTGPVKLVDEVDFGVYEGKWSCDDVIIPTRDTSMIADKSWVQLPGVGLIQNVVRLTFVCKTGEWLEFVTEQGSWKKQNGAWIKTHGN